MNGPVRLVKVKRAPDGTFAIRATIVGDTIDLRPPDPGTAACAATAEGGRVCVTLAPSPTCDQVTTCSGTADCFSGEICVLSSCCGSPGNVCGPSFFLCGDGSASGAFVAPVTSGMGRTIF